VLRAPILHRLLLVTIAAGIGSGTAVAAPPTQELVTLRATHAVYSTPSATATSLTPVAGKRPITGVWTVLPLVGRADDGWLRVRLPGRPNGAIGWIRERSTRLTTTPWRLVVDTSERRVRVLHDGHVVRTFRAVVGKSSTPTPTGGFFVEEAVRLSPSDAGAPFALALSARSNVLQEFEGGPGQIAFHGLANVGGVPGTAVSHGCIRLDDPTMRWLAARIGAGVPVTITH
jgi:lipoprotein-anchoring transpeptidase ErfK/SrfK